MNVRLVPSHITMAYSEVALNEEKFKKEFSKLSESDDDPISQWLKLAKGRGETAESDQVLLNLVVELHRKIDALEMFLKDEKPKRVHLEHEAEIESIGFEHFKVSSDIFVSGVEYYGRVEIPVHPKRDVPIFFRAVDSSLAEITKMHERDEKEWGAYLTARERVLIREAKAK